MSKVLVVGGGASGMMAAIFAARNGQKVQIIEKNEKLGKKLFITGKGRCNITNAADVEDLFAAVVGNPKFLYSGFYSFSNMQVIDFFEELGVRTKIERGDRVFPVSDHSSDVISALERELRRLGVKISLHTAVDRVIYKEEPSEYFFVQGSASTVTRSLWQREGFLTRLQDLRGTGIVLPRKRDTK